MASPRSVWKDGVTAGVLGAGGVAVWILAVDTIAGHPFSTPGLLGKAMLSVLGRGIENHGTAFFVCAYTVLHLAAFVAVGCIASFLLTQSGRAPQYTAGLALFFAVFETGFYFLALMLSATDVLGGLAWYQIGLANLVASALTGGYLLRRHPEFAGNLRHALDGSS
jgi:hypothetical protein